MGQISFSVPMIEQGDNPICWIACVAMVTSFKKHASIGISHFTGGFDPSSSCIPDPNNGWADLYRNLARFHFAVTGGDSSLSPGVIEQTLRRRGPFIGFFFVADFPFSGPMCSNMTGTGNETHAMVVAGIDTRIRKVKIVNPWGTNVPPVDLDVVVSELQRIADTGCHPIAFYN